MTYTLCLGVWNTIPQVRCSRSHLHDAYRSDSIVSQKRQLVVSGVMPSSIGRADQPPDGCRCVMTCCRDAGGNSSSMPGFIPQPTIPPDANAASARWPGTATSSTSGYWSNPIPTRRWDNSPQAVALNGHARIYATPPDGRNKSALRSRHVASVLGSPSERVCHHPLWYLSVRYLLRPPALLRRLLPHLAVSPDCHRMAPIESTVTVRRYSSIR